MKIFLLSFLLFGSTSSFAQSGYVQQTINNGDTTLLFFTNQIQWKLLQGVRDYIVESKLGAHGNRVDVKHHIISRKYDGQIKEYVVDGRDKDDFTIRFNQEDKNVTYIYHEKMVLYRGRNIAFEL